MRSKEFTRFRGWLAETEEGRVRGSQSLEGVRAIMSGIPGLFVLPDDVVVETVVADRVPCEWVRVPETDEERVILYAHGGCYISGSPETVREFCARLAREAQARVLVPDYRLAPEHPFPAALDDVMAAYEWLLTQGVRPDKLTVAGESAGGGLTLAILMLCRDRGLPMPACGVPLSPWVDMRVQWGESLRRNLGIDMASVEPLRIGGRSYVGTGDFDDPLCSPLHADLRDLPPLLIQVGTAEVLHDEGVEVARRAREAGVDVTLQEWDDMVHVWHWFASWFPEARDAIVAIGGYVREHSK